MTLDEWYSKHGDTMRISLADAVDIWGDAFDAGYSQAEDEAAQDAAEENI